MILDLLKWEPSLPLATGMKETYDWIRTQMVSGGIK
jgi:nucleoside-diphosphate-sugar epimerase